MDKEYESLYKTLERLSEEWRLAYGDDLDHTIDVINALGNINPVSAEEVGIALKKTAERMREIGPDFTTVLGKEFE